MQVNTDISYSSDKRRIKLKQFGQSSNLMSRPLQTRLKTYEQMAKYDPLIKQGLNILIDALLGSISFEPEHPDPDISNFIKYTNEHLLQEYAIDIKSILRNVIKTSIWAGFSVTESIYEIVDSKVLLKDLVTYHPSTIIIRTDKKGRLDENNVSGDSAHLRSGIYQHNNQIPIPLWKVALLTHDFEYNNYYGTSALEACYRWHIIKEAMTDLMTIALERHGNPLSVYIIPNLMTSELMENPLTGETESVNAQQLLERQLQQTAEGDISHIILPFVDSSMKPDVKVINTPQNLTVEYTNAIRFCEVQQIRNLLLPYGFIESSFSDANAGNSSSEERQIEIFNRVLHSLYLMYVIPFVKQVYQRLIKLNFNRDSASIPPTFALRKATRPEDRVALMQMIKGLTDFGYFNPTNKLDWAMVREMVDGIDRPLGKDDIEFIKQLIIYPRQKPEPANNAAKPAAKGTTDPSRDRTNEGKVKGTGQPGRTTGVSKPQQTPRDTNRGDAK